MIVQTASIVDVLVKSCDSVSGELTMHHAEKCVRVSDGVRKFKLPRAGI
jgi:hypothetical protein